MRGALVGGYRGYQQVGKRAGGDLWSTDGITEIRLRVASAVVLFHACPFLHVRMIALAPRSAIASWQPLAAYTPVATDDDERRSHLTPVRNRNGPQHFLAAASTAVSSCLRRPWCERDHSDVQERASVEKHDGRGHPQPDFGDAVGAPQVAACPLPPLLVAPVSTDQRPSHSTGIVRNSNNSPALPCIPLFGRLIACHGRNSNSCPLVKTARYRIFSFRWHGKHSKPYEI